MKTNSGSAIFSYSDLSPDDPELPILTDNPMSGSADQSAAFIDRPVMLSVNFFKTFLNRIHKRSDHSPNVAPVLSSNFALPYLLLSFQMHLKHVLKKHADLLSAHDARTVEKRGCLSGWADADAQSITNIIELYATSVEFNQVTRTLASALNIARNILPSDTLATTFVQATVNFLDENPASLLRHYAACGWIKELVQMREPLVDLNDNEILENYHEDLQSLIKEINNGLGDEVHGNNLLSRIANLVSLGEQYSDAAVLIRVLCIALIDQLSEKNFHHIPFSQRAWIYNLTKEEAKTRNLPSNKIAYLTAAAKNIYNKNDIVNNYGFGAWITELLDIDALPKRWADDTKEKYPSKDSFGYPIDRDEKSNHARFVLGACVDKYFASMMQPSKEIALATSYLELAVFSQTVSSGKPLQVRQIKSSPYAGAVSDDDEERMPLLATSSDDDAIAAPSLPTHLQLTFAWGVAGIHPVTLKTLALLSLDDAQKLQTWRQVLEKQAESSFSFVVKVNALLLKHVNTFDDDAHLTFLCSFDAEKMPEQNDRLMCFQALMDCGRAFLNYLMYVQEFSKVDAASRLKNWSQLIYDVISTLPSLISAELRHVLHTNSELANGLYLEYGSLESISIADQLDFLTRALGATKELKLLVSIYESIDTLLADIEQKLTVTPNSSKGLQSIARQVFASNPSCYEDFERGFQEQVVDKIYSEDGVRPLNGINDKYFISLLFSKRYYSASIKEETIPQYCQNIFDLYDYEDSFYFHPNIHEANPVSGRIYLSYCENERAIIYKVHKVDKENGVVGQLEIDQDFTEENFKQLQGFIQKSSNEKSEARLNFPNEAGKNAEKAALEVLYRKGDIVIGQPKAIWWELKRRFYGNDSALYNLAHYYHKTHVNEFARRNALLIAYFGFWHEAFKNTHKHAIHLLTILKTIHDDANLARLTPQEKGYVQETITWLNTTPDVFSDADIKVICALQKCENKNILGEQVVKEIDTLFSKVAGQQAIATTITKADDQLTKVESLLGVELSLDHFSACIRQRFKQVKIKLVIEPEVEIPKNVPVKAEERSQDNILREFNQYIVMLVEGVFPGQGKNLELRKKLWGILGSLGVEKINYKVLKGALIELYQQNRQSQRLSRKINNEIESIFKNVYLGASIFSSYIGDIAPGLDELVKEARLSTILDVAGSGVHDVEEENVDEAHQSARPVSTVDPKIHSTYVAKAVHVVETLFDEAQNLAMALAKIKVNKDISLVMNVDDLTEQNIETYYQAYKAARQIDLFERRIKMIRSGKALDCFKEIEASENDASQELQKFVDRMQNGEKTSEKSVATEQEKQAYNDCIEAFFWAIVQKELITPSINIDWSTLIKQPSLDTPAQAQKNLDAFDYLSSQGFNLAQLIIFGFSRFLLTNKDEYWRSCLELLTILAKLAGKMYAGYNGYNKQEQRIVDEAKKAFVAEQFSNVGIDINHAGLILYYNIYLLALLALRAGAIEKSPTFGSLCQSLLQRLHHLLLVNQPFREWHRQIFYISHGHDSTLSILVHHRVDSYNSLSAAAKEVRDQTGYEEQEINRQEYYWTSCYQQNLLRKSQLDFEAKAIFELVLLASSDQALDFYGVKVNPHHEDKWQYNSVLDQLALIFMAAKNLYGNKTGNAVTSPFEKSLYLLDVINEDEPNTVIRRLLQRACQNFSQAFTNDINSVSGVVFDPRTTMNKAILREIKETIDGVKEITQIYIEQAKNQHGYSEAEMEFICWLYRHKESRVSGESKSIFSNLSMLLFSFSPKSNLPSTDIASASAQASQDLPDLLKNVFIYFYDSLSHDNERLLSLESFLAKISEYNLWNAYYCFINSCFDNPSLHGIFSDRRHADKLLDCLMSNSGNNENIRDNLVIKSLGVIQHCTEVRQEIDKNQLNSSQFIEYVSVCRAIYRLASSENFNPKILDSLKKLLYGDESSPPIRSASLGR